MATYGIRAKKTTNGSTWLSGSSLRSKADERLEELRAAGRFARLVKWENNTPKEMASVNG